MTAAYEKAEAYIADLPRFKSTGSLEETRKMVQLLPGTDIESKIIHVAGTNGKGSVCQFLNRLLLADGYQVGVFTSPHLVEMRERMVFNDERISRQQFVQAYEQVRLLCEQHSYQPVFFEFFFFMMMVLCRQKQPDYIILETGLGGRLDATNVFDEPAMTIITQIGLDHQMVLGDTRAQIAHEKAGIIKPGVPLVYANTDVEVSNVLQKEAAEKKAMAYSVDKAQISNINIKHKSIDFSYKSRYYNNVSFILSTTACYQMENAALALWAYELLIPKEQTDIHRMQLAIQKTVWPGRMEEIAPAVFLDGAHNTDGIEAFLASVRCHEVTGRRILLFSAVSDKDYKQMIDKLEQSGLFETYILTGISDTRGVSNDRLVSAFGRCGGQTVIQTSNVSEAYQKACQLKGQEDVLYIVGSLYLAGEIKSLLKEESK